MNATQISKEAQPLCATRAVKVLKFLHRMVPKAVPRSSLHALEKLPSSVLAGLHSTSDWDKVTEDAQLKNWLANNPIPSPKAKVSAPLFHGTLVFVQLIFQKPNQLPSSVSMADVQTALNYATLAVVAIQQYASQYGPNSVSVSPNIIPFTATLTGDSFTQAQFEGWVEQCAQAARNNNVSNPCIVILHNRDLSNSPQFSNHRDSYHSMTGNGTPYCYCLVFGQNLSVADNNHTINGIPNEKVYAHNLSHEIAEMVVDPLVDGSNPEVCDACAGNCNNSQFDLFDQNGVFMGGTADTASASGFSFFINSIVRPDAYDTATQCVVQGGDVQSACIYPPPIQVGKREFLFLADPNGGIYTSSGDPNYEADHGNFAGFGRWRSVSEGSSTPGGPVTAIPWGNNIALFLADPNGGIYTALGDPNYAADHGNFAGFGRWRSVSEGSSTPGARVTAIPWGNNIALFLADPNGGIYTALGDPNYAADHGNFAGFGPWRSVSEGSSKPGAPVAAVG
jgi:hypothetical protein